MNGRANLQPTEASLRNRGAQVRYRGEWMDVPCVALIFTLTAFGCGKSAPYEVVPVSGKVTLDGEPLSNARLTFQPMAGSSQNREVGPGSVGFSDESGTYVLETVYPVSKGAVVGAHTVRISTGTTESDADNARIVGEKVPPWYLDGTVRLRRKITSSTDDLDFALHSDFQQAKEAEESP